MGKKKKKSTGISQARYHHAGLIKFLAAIGAVISLVYHAIGIANAVAAGVPDILDGIVFPVLGIVVDIILLGSLGLINHKWIFEMTWLSLLILGIIEAILDATVGTVLIVIAALVALFDRL
jgi:hypothetical protein